MERGRARGGERESERRKEGEERRKEGEREAEGGRARGGERMSERRREGKREAEKAREIKERKCFQMSVRPVKRERADPIL